MAAIVEIKRKIEGIKKLEKITNVMKIIAVSKINKYKQLFLQNSDFNEILYRIISQTIPFCDKEKNQSNSTLWIIFSSSLGMAGNFNLNIFKNLSQNVKPEDKIIIFGKKGMNFISAKKLNQSTLFSSSISEKEFTYFQLTSLVKKIFYSYKKNMFGNISLIYSKFERQKVKCTNVSIFPLIIDKNTISDFNYNFEQQPEIIYEKTIKFYLQSMIYSAFIESKFCEQVSRKNAMMEANDNITKTITELKNQYNKKRQEKITNELAKVI